MEQRWNSDGTAMERLWNAHGTLIERLWNAYGTPTERLWNAYGTPGKPPESSWKASGKSLGEKKSQSPGLQPVSTHLACPPEWKSETPPDYLLHYALPSFLTAGASCTYSTVLAVLLAYNASVNDRALLRIT